MAYDLLKCKKKVFFSFLFKVQVVQGDAVAQLVNLLIFHLPIEMHFED